MSAPSKKGFTVTTISLVLSISERLWPTYSNEAPLSTCVYVALRSCIFGQLGERFYGWNWMRQLEHVQSEGDRPSPLSLRYTLHIIGRDFPTGLSLFRWAKRMSICFVWSLELWSFCSMDGSLSATDGQSLHCVTYKLLSSSVLRKVVFDHNAQYSCFIVVIGVNWLMID